LQPKQISCKNQPVTPKNKTNYITVAANPNSRAKHKNKRKPKLNDKQI
jgi:hypothetical protein